MSQVRRIFITGSVTGRQVTLGRSPIRGGGTYKGWELHCTVCGWRHRVNDGKRIAERVAKEHVHKLEPGE